MEVTYDGALVMPSGCVMMDEDEMTYVEGGAISLNTNTTGIVLDVVIGLAATALGGGFASITSKLIAKYGAKKAGLHFGNMAAKYAAKYFAAKFCSYLGGAISLAFAVMCAASSPGQALAKYIATHDNTPKNSKMIDLF